MNKLHLKLFGPFKATLNGTEITTFGSDKVRALLAYLAVENSRPHSRQNLAGLLWHDQPHSEALHSLREALDSLRKSLGEDNGMVEPGENQNHQPFLIISGDTIQFNPESNHHLDITGFESLYEAALTHYHGSSDANRLNPRLLQRALNLSTGPLLDQFCLMEGSPFEEWVLLRRESLNGKAIEGLELLMAYHERRGEYVLARQMGQRLVELAPWEENAHRLIMRLLAFEGQWNSAQAQYSACRRYLTEELSVEPTPETIQLFEEIQFKSATNQAFSPNTPQAIHNLTNSLSPCLGRERELDDLSELIADPHYRLITLLGPAGIGKTRLALEAAQEQIGLFPDGVFFVPLVEVENRVGLLAAIAKALDFNFPEQGNPEDHLLNYLYNKKMLLVLDHLEDHVGEVDLVAGLMSYPPDLEILVTSRQRLNLREEYPFVVSGLSFPKSELVGITDIPKYGALALFLDRFRRVQGEMFIDQSQLSAAILICELVEGMPLGLELAAGAARSCSLTQIADDLAESMGFLSSGYSDNHSRHQSIQAAFQLSWNKLSDAEKHAFQNLTVFRGGFNAQAAVQITGATTETLRSLCAKSLIHPQTGSIDRYDMHEVLKKFARDKLERDAHQCEDIKEQHANYYIGYLHAINIDLTGSDQANALKALSQEFDNVLQAWEWSVLNGLRENIEKGFEGLYHYSSLRARLQEGVYWLDQAIERWCEKSKDYELCAKLLSRRGSLLRRQGQIETARNSIEDSLDIIRRIGNEKEEIFSLVELAGIANQVSNYEKARRIARVSLSKSKQMNHPWGICASLHELGALEYRLGKVNEAEMILEENLSVARLFNMPRYVLKSLNTLGDIDCHHGKYQQAAEKFEECLALSNEIGDRYSSGFLLNNLGTVFHLEGEYRAAADYYQQSLDHCIDIGDGSGQAIALSNLGEIAQLSGAYAKAKSFYERGLKQGYEIQDDWTVMACLINLGELSCHLNRCHQAELYLLDAIRIASTTNTMQMLTKALVSIGELYLQLGLHQRALDCVCYALRHPASEQHTLDKAQDLIEKAGVELKDCHIHTLEDVLHRLMGDFILNSPDIANYF